MTQLLHGIAETTITAGTGTLSLGGQVPGASPFAARLAVAATVPYVLANGTNKEWGIGTVGAGNTLARTTITGTLVAGVYTVGGVAITLVGSSQVSAVEHEGYDFQTSMAAHIVAASPHGATYTTPAQAAAGATTIVANYAALPVAGISGVIYVATDTGRAYRWTGSVYNILGFPRKLTDVSADFVALGTQTDGAGVPTGVLVDAGANKITRIKSRFYPSAVGDGVTDDTAAIQAAINAANAAGGGTVVLDPKTYLVIGPLTPKDSVTIQGVSPTYNTIQTAPDFNDSLTGGTLLQGAATAGAVTNQNLFSFNTAQVAHGFDTYVKNFWIKDIGIKNYASAIVGGAQDH